MKTLARRRDKEELLRRVRTIRPDSVRRWGRMSARQMLCHLNDSFCMATGERPVHRTPPLRQRTIIKWIALYLPVRWPPGIVTVAEVDQEQGGTKPGDFAADAARLEALIERVSTQTMGFVWPSHPIFGTMSAAEWLRWGYLHTDHHLRQFGR
jgi:hypothetical protein